MSEMGGRRYNSGMSEKFEVSPEKLGDKAYIPDSDMVGWIETLRELGLSQDEMDRMLANLNDAYKKGLGEKYVRMEVEKLAEKSKENGIILTQYQREHLADQIRKSLERD